MSYTDYQKSIINPYNDLLTKIVREGYETPITRMLMDQSITFDLHPLNISSTNWNMMMPLKRGSITSSMKYAAAEAVWYLAQTREIDLIVKYGKIWAKMTDDQGLINSNYGYQLSHNQNLTDKLEELFETSKTVLNIISTENQNSTNDLVCNNQVVLSLSVGFDGAYELTAKVNARSIDVMFGLPYDMFAAQGLMCIIAEALHNVYEIDVHLNTLTFNISNVHWYHRQNPSEEQLQELSSEMLVIPYQKTPYSLIKLGRADLNYTDLLSDDSLKRMTRDYRQSMVDAGMEVRCFSDRNLSEMMVDGDDVLVKTDTLDQLDEIIISKSINEHILHHASVFGDTIKLTADEQDRLVDHWTSVVKSRLAANKFDRKAVYFDDQTNNIYYTVYYRDHYHLLRFAPNVVNDNE